VFAFGKSEIVRASVRRSPFFSRVGRTENTREFPLESMTCAPFSTAILDYAFPSNAEDPAMDMAKKELTFTPWFQ